MLPFRFTAKTIIDEGRTSQKSIDAIKNWLISTPLPQIQDEFTILFLLSCSNNIESTKKRIEAYFKIKNGSPHIFNDFKVENEKIVTIRKVLAIYVVSYPVTNTAVICGKLIDTNYHNLEIIPVIKHACMSLFVSQVDNPPNDVIVILDLKGVGVMHLTRVKIGVFSTLLHLVQEGLPVKIRHIHILNSTYIFDRWLSLFRMFIKNELFNTFKTHTSEIKWSEFHEKWVPACFLPEEYGGELESFDKLICKTEEEIKIMQDFYDAEEELRKKYKL